MRAANPPTSGRASDRRYDAQAAAHDVNNLLHVILGCCERLRPELPAHQRDELTHITVAAEHAAALASRILGSGAATAARTIDLQAAVQRLEGLLRRILGDDVAVTVSLPPEGTSVRMHEGDLAQILVNLAVNARDAMPTGGELTIAVNVEASSDVRRASDAPARAVRLRVADTGVGMAADVRDRVFERFFTTKAGDGTGHGLATVRSIVERYGGTIELRSEPGHGAEFTILLPILESRRAGAAVVAAPRRGNGETVLVVDDEPMARDVVMSFLDGLGYATVGASSGREALAIVSSGRRIDLIVADVTMPDLSGIDLSRQVARAAPAIPVLLVSGDTRESLPASEIPIEFLQKPFSAADLGSRVRDLLDAVAVSPAPAPSRHIRFDTSIVDSLPAPIFVLQDGRFAYVNRPFCTLLALPATELLGRSGVERVHPDDRPVFPRHPDHAGAADEAVATTQVRVRGGDGAERNLVISSRAIPHDGTPAILGVAIDVTLQPDAVTVAARMAALGRLAGGIAHDYNNLLQVVGGHLEHLRQSLPAESALHHDVEAIAGAARRAGTLTDNLLSFGRRQLLELRPVDVGVIVQAVAAELPGSLGPAIVTQVESSPDLPPVEADTPRLREVLWHLIENAREAMPSGGTLTFAVDTTTVDRDLKAQWSFLSEGSVFVRLRVIDTGWGMDSAVAAHAFEPFFTTKGKGRGAGMGLASVYGIVKQTGGYVFAERTGEQGTCMTVLLPPAAAHAPRVPPVRPPSAATGDRRHNRILLIEDDDGVRELLVDVLERNGYVVQAAGSAEDGEGLAQQGSFDLLLTDLDLPGMDGARFAASVTARQPDVQVIVMSGYPDDGTLDAAAAGRPAFLRKPFTSATLLDHVGRALNRHADRRGE